MNPIADLGDKVRDLISGFEGIVAGRCEYINGCVQLLVSPPAKDGERKGGEWIDVGSLEVVQPGVVSVARVRSVYSTNGAAQPGGPSAHAPSTRY